MPKDTKSKNQNKIVSSKKRDNSRFKKKKDESSDSNYSDNSISDDEELDVQKYHKFLAKTFPSKHMDKKVKAGKQLEHKLKNDMFLHLVEMYNSLNYPVKIFDFK